MSSPDIDPSSTSPPPQNCLPSFPSASINGSYVGAPPTTASPIDNQYIVALQQSWMKQYFASQQARLAQQQSLQEAGDQPQRKRPLIEEPNNSANAFAPQLNLDSLFLGGMPIPSYNSGISLQQGAAGFPINFPIGSMLPPHPTHLGQTTSSINTMPQAHTPSFNNRLRPDQLTKWPSPSSGQDEAVSSSSVTALDLTGNAQAAGFDPQGSTSSSSLLYDDEEPTIKQELRWTMTEVVGTKCELQETRSQIENLRVEMNKMIEAERERMRAWTASIAERTQKMKEDKDASIRRLQTQLEEARGSMATMDAQLQEDTRIQRDSNVKILELRGKLDNCTRSLAENMKQLDENRSREEKRERRVRDLKEELKRDKETIQTQTKEAERMRQREKRLIGLKEQADAQNKASSDQEIARAESAERRVNTMEKEQTRLQNEIRKTKEELDLEREEKERLLQQLEEAQRLIEQMKLSAGTSSSNEGAKEGVNKGVADIKEEVVENMEDDRQEENQTPNDGADGEEDMEDNFEGEENEDVPFSPRVSPSAPCNLSERAQQRRAHYNQANVVFEKFPELTRDTDTMLVDFAADLNKPFKEVIDESDERWTALKEIVITAKEKAIVDARMTEHDDEDMRTLLNLFVFFAKERGKVGKGGKMIDLSCVDHLIDRLNLPSIEAAIEHLQKSRRGHMSYPQLFSLGPDHSRIYLYIVDRAIPVVGGIRRAILSLVAFTKLCDTEITNVKAAADVVKYFYCATGLTLNKPKYVKYALDIF